MDKPITQDGIDRIIGTKNEEDFDLSVNIDIENNYRVEDMENGDIVIITIYLLNGRCLKKECQIIDSNGLLLLAEENDHIQLRYDDDDKYYMVSSE